MVTSAVTAAIANLQSKHKDDIQSLQFMLEKFFSKGWEILLPTIEPNIDLLTIFLSLIKTTSTPKPLAERWNQANLGYFNPLLDKVHGEYKIVWVGKDIYYRNVVLFVQRFQSLVTFWGVALVKVNIAILLQGSVLECYTFKPGDFDCNVLNNDSGLKSWINTLFHSLKIPTSVVFGVLTNKIYFFDDVWA